MSDTYYKPLKIAENIYHIYEPGNVYTTLIIGEEKALLIVRVMDLVIWQHL